MTSVGVIVIVASQEVLFFRLSERIHQTVEREVNHFRLDTAEEGNVKTRFDRYLVRTLPHEYLYLLTFIDGKLYKSFPGSLPQDLLKAIIQKKATSGEIRTQSGTYLLQAEPLAQGGKVRGQLVAAYCLSCDRKAIDDSTSIMAIAFIISILAVSALAWDAAGRILAPLKLLTQTAHKITEADFTQRIPLRGYGEIAEMTATFNEMLDRLEIAFASQRQFINDASHELRTPITIIRGHLELLEEEPEERKETVALVLDELDRVSRFVEDLLLLAKAEQPKFLVMQTVDMATLTEEIFAKASALAPRQWYLESKAPVKLVADSQRLTQAVINLAENAVKHTDGKIAIGSAVQGNNVALWVRDSGRGIPEPQQERIFERFVQIDSPRSADGVGLGLSIVRAIASAHFGQVTLECQPGQGCLFSIVLPLNHQMSHHEPYLDR
ncbi:MAG: HAMP domain-containing histidine kinase [Anaerolineae bacterium]|nr:HAMP domain-containing histidine kinase [Gloeobacterales cyanobacterium ES-bin-313]